jgi:hypothetical protein
MAAFLVYNIVVVPLAMTMFFNSCIIFIYKRDVFTLFKKSF